MLFNSQVHNVSRFSLTNAYIYNFYPLYLKKYFRSPTVAISTAGPFNTENNFGTIRSNNQKVQDTLNFQAPSQKTITQRPTNKPPPPPRTASFTNIHANSTTVLSVSSNDQNWIPKGTTNFESSNMEKSEDRTDSLAPPPPPPPRISSSGVSKVSQTPNFLMQTPPEIPRRHSSIRNENDTNSKLSKVNSNQPISRLIVDIEARYSLLFHNISEFPAPNAFMNVEKSYPSKAMRPVPNGI